MEDTFSFGQNLKEILKQKHIPAILLAKNIGITPATLSRYINDQRCPNTYILRKISKALNVSPNELLGIIPRQKKSYDELLSLLQDNAPYFSTNEKLNFISAAANIFNNLPA